VDMTSRTCMATSFPEVGDYFQATGAYYKTLVRTGNRGDGGISIPSLLFLPTGKIATRSSFVRTAHRMLSYPFDAHSTRGRPGTRPFR
jgi:hypothetical protein